MTYPQPIISADLDAAVTAFLATLPRDYRRVQALKGEPRDRLTGERLFPLRFGDRPLAEEG